MDASTKAAHSSHGVSALQSNAAAMERLVESLGLDELGDPDSPKLIASWSAIVGLLRWFDAVRGAEIGRPARTGRPPAALRKEFIRRALRLFHRFRYRPADAGLPNGRDRLSTTSPARSSRPVREARSVSGAVALRDRWHRPADQAINRPEETARFRKGAMTALSDLEAREREFVSVLLHEAGMRLNSEALRKALGQIERHPDDWNRRRAAITVKRQRYTKKSPRSWVFPGELPTR